MRVDYAAAARANMRTRTIDEGAQKLMLTEDEIQARHAKQGRLNTVMAACALCCRRTWLSPDGSELECAVLKSAVENGLPLSAEEVGIAKGCSMPRIYAEVMAGDRADLVRLDVLEAIPFHVDDSHFVWAHLELARAAWQAGTAAPDQVALLVAHGIVPAGWELQAKLEGKRPDAQPLVPTPAKGVVDVSPAAPAPAVAAAVAAAAPAAPKPKAPAAPAEPAA